MIFGTHGIDQQYWPYRGPHRVEATWSSVTGMEPLVAECQAGDVLLAAWGVDLAYNHPRWGIWKQPSQT